MPDANAAPVSNRNLGIARPIVGHIKPLDGAVDSANWLLCDGRQLPIEHYEALFAQIGARFGGDGRVTFALPNLCAEHDFVICIDGLYPRVDAPPGEWRAASDEAELIGWQAIARKEVEQSVRAPGTRPQHSTTLDPEWLHAQCQAMQDAYSRGDDPLHRHLDASEVDAQLLERQVQTLCDAYSRGDDPFHRHTHSDDLDPDWLNWQAQSVSDACARGDDPLHHHLHESELDPEWVARQSQCLIDAHARGQAPLHNCQHEQQLDAHVLERQVQTMKDAYAQGVDPLAALHTHVDDVAPEWLASQAQCVSDAHAAGHDATCSHTHVEQLDDAQLAATVAAMQAAYERGEDPLAAEEPATPAR